MTAVWDGEDISMGTQMPVGIGQYHGGTGGAGAFAGRQSQSVWEDALWEEELQIRENGSEGPIVLVDWQDGGLEANDHGEMILQFMGRNGYELAWQNDRFAVYGTDIVR